MATLSLTNCMKETQTAPDAVGIPYTIYAGLDEDTKTVNDGLSTRWAEDDTLNVFHTEAGTDWYSENTMFTISDVETGQFETDLLNGELSAVNDWFVLYPYNSHIISPANVAAGYLPVGGKAGNPQVQTGNSNMAHIAGPNYPMWGVAMGVESQELPYVRMTHLSSLVEVVVTNNAGVEAKVKSLSMAAAEDITGTYYIDFTTDEPTFESSGDIYVSNEVKLNVVEGEYIPAGGSAKFYFAIKPFTAHAGDFINLTVNGEEKAYELTEDVTFAPGKIKTLTFSLDEYVELVPGPVTSNMVWTLGEKAYNEVATINGEAEVPVLKLGTSSVAGTATITVPAGTTKLGFYAVSWNGKSAVLGLMDGETVVGEVEPPVNTGAANNSPYTIDEDPSLCYFEIEVNAEEDKEYTLTTTGNNNRVIIWGLNYYTADGIGEEQTPVEPEPDQPDEAVVATVAEVLAAEVSSDVWYQMTGTIKNIVCLADGSVNPYGNFDLEDETGSIYVYGLTATKVAKNDKSFPTLGLKEGDVVTIIGTRAEYKGSAQVGGPAYYVSHESGSTEDPTPDGETFTWDLTIADYLEADENQVQWYSDYAIMMLEKAESSTVANNYIGGGMNNGNECVHTRVYKGQILTICPVATYMPLKTVFTATSADYASKLVNSEWTNAEVVSDDKIVTVTPVDATVPVAVTISAATRFTDVTVHYVYDETFVPADTDEPEPEDPVEPEPDQPEIPADPADIANGNYWIIADGKVATPLTEDKSYGYLNVEDAVDGASTAANAFTFTKADDGSYMIQDSFGRYVYQTGNYNSFNVSTELGNDNGYYWTISMSGDAYVIMNNAVNKFIQYDTKYNSYGSYVDARGVLPVLVLADNQIEEPEPEPEPEPDQPGEIVPATIAEVLAAEVDANVWYEITGKIVNIASTTYGNFDLMDETGSIYVYGLTATQVAKNDKSFESLGLKAGDIVTLIGTRAEYNGTPQVGGPAYYVSHEAGADEPEPEPEEPGQGDDVITAEYKLSFADISNRIEFTPQQQVWSQNGVVLTNDKAASTNDVADYYNPARFYKNSSITIEMEDGAAITKIVFTCNASKYTTALMDSIQDATAEGNVVTVEFDTPVTSYVIEALSGGQVRLNDLTVYAD